MPPIQYFPFEKRYKYPHMAPLDVAIWERFIEKHAGRFTSVAYDIAVGQGTPMDTVVNRETGGDVNRLYQRRIDALGITDTFAYVIEVKPRASTASIGQLKGYVKLFVRDYSPVLPVQPLLVTDELLPEMEFLAKDEGVLLEIV